MTMYLGTTRVRGLALGNTVYDGLALGNNQDPNDYGLIRYFDDDPASKPGNWVVNSGFGGGKGTNANGITFNQTVSGSCNAELDRSTLLVGKEYEIKVHHDSTSAGNMSFTMEQNGVAEGTQITVPPGTDYLYQFTCTSNLWNVQFFSLSTGVGLYVIASIYLRRLT